MEHFIIGTAGHVDHGKTALIKALTGNDTDSMPEEKKRGISIDLGFTYFSLPTGQKAGIIDVPGHEKFLPNMLAGVCGMDLVLLVIAADEGIMPQTLEHIEILHQLKIDQGIIVLSKCDLVEEGWPELMAEDIKEQLSHTLCGEWPLIPISAKTGMGMEKLIATINEKAGSLNRNRKVDGSFRLPIDRVLSPRGIGTVVAGTLLEGSIHVDDELMLYPQELSVRIKSMQVHGEDRKTAHAGQRVAISLAGIDKKQVKRGNVVAYPKSISPSDRMDVVISMGHNTARSIKNQSRAHIHIGTTEAIARIVLLDQDQVSAGEKAYAQLIFQEKLTGKKGDNFVIRFLSPLETIGGGSVLVPCATKHKRFDAATLSFLAHKEENKGQELVQGIISDHRQSPISLTKLAEKAGMEAEELRDILKILEEDKDIIAMEGKKTSFLWAWDNENEFRWQLKDKIESYMKKNPYSPGFTKLMAKTILLNSWDNSAVDAYVNYLHQNQTLKVQEYKKDTYYTLIEYQQEQRETEQELEANIIRLVHNAGFNLGDMALLEHPSLDENQFQQYLGFLVRKGRLVHIKDNFYTSPQIASQIIALVNQYFESQEIISFSSLRDLLDTSRKTAKPLMAWLDQCKVTAWSGKETERKKYN